MSPEWTRFKWYARHDSNLQPSAWKERNVSILAWYRVAPNAREALSLLSPT